MFWNPLRLGGDPAKVGSAAAYFASKIAFLRATRAMVASTFRYLCIPLHAAMVGLLEFIVEIMDLFSSQVRDSSVAMGEPSGLPEGMTTADLLSFGQVNMLLVEVLVTFVVLVLTGVNAFAPKAADGGHGLKVAYSLSITMALTGLLMLAVPALANMIFSSIVET